MSYYIIVCIFFVLSFLVLRYILRTSIQNYNLKLWSVVEVIWLLNALVGVLLGINEINRIKTQNEFINKEQKVKICYYEARMAIYGRSSFLRLENAVTSEAKENIRWLFKMRDYIDYGYSDIHWQNFLYYTKGYVFKYPGYLYFLDEDVPKYNWPVDKNIDPKNLPYLEDISYVVEKLDTLKEAIGELNKNVPAKRPDMLFRILWPFVFLLTLTLKLLKIEADYRKYRTVTLTTVSHPKKAVEEIDEFASKVNI